MDIDLDYRKTSNKRRVSNKRLGLQQTPGL